MDNLINQDIYSEVISLMYVQMYNYKKNPNIDLTNVLTAHRSYWIFEIAKPLQLGRKVL